MNAYLDIISRFAIREGLGLIQKHRLEVRSIYRQQVISDNGGVGNLKQIGFLVSQLCLRVSRSYVNTSWLHSFVSD